MNNKPIKGRGAQSNIHNRFEQEIHERRAEFLEYCRLSGEENSSRRTKYLPIYPKTIVNKVSSPDVGMEYSMNPYQGCEHGCIYCYARNTHEYWGYSPGLDFEKQILIKKDAAMLLEKKIGNKNWQAYTIVLSGNTDCYQPAEKKYKITRACLEIFLKYKHPVGIITKNSLILRDLDLLKRLNQDNLVAVNISITTLSEKTRRLLEPRTATIKKRLNTIKILSENGIPVIAMLAPIIPGINSHELLPMAKKVAEMGAKTFGLTVVRLNGSIGNIFTEWIQTAMPNSAEKVLSQIAACHGGSLNDSRFGIRGKGEGKIAEQIHATAKIAKMKYFNNAKFPSLDKTLHQQYKKGQYQLF